MLEPTIVFEYNFAINSDRKLAKYGPVFNSLRRNCNSIKFVYLSMSTLGIFGASSDSHLQMLEDLHFDANVQSNILMKASNIVIRFSFELLILSYLHHHLYSVLYFSP